MKNIMTIAVSTYKEIVRSKVFYVGLVFSVALTICALLYKILTLGEEVNFMKNVGLATIQILGMLTAAFVGANLIQKEIDTKTIQVLFAKPVRKDEFILGKFLGGVGIIIVNMALMTAGVLLVLLVRTNQFNFGLLKAIVPMAFEFFILLATAMLISTFATSLLSGIFTVCIFFIGHVTSLLPYAINKAGNLIIKYLISAIYYLLPNLSHLDLKTAVVNGVSIPLSLFLGILAYGAIYCSMLLIVAMLSFRAKEVV